MLGHVSYVHTETALSLIDDETSRLEDGCNILVLLIEILKSHKVSEKSVEVAKDIKELAHRLYIACLFSKSRILSYESKEGILLVLLSKAIECIKA